jgi:hypothetical protein
MAFHFLSTKTVWRVGSRLEDVLIELHVVKGSCFEVLSPHVMDSVSKCGSFRVLPVGVLVGL